MTVAPLQAFGIGDIIFCQTIANMWLSEGHKVVWGTYSQFVEGLNRAYPNVTFVDWKTLPIDYGRKDTHEANGYYVVPLRWSDSLCKVPYHQCMQSKYKLFGLDWNIWRDGAMWVRDKGREAALIAHLRLPKRFNLINLTFGSDGLLKVPVSISNDLPNVEMKAIDGYSLFDWAGVMELASEIHTVSTSIIYIMEMLVLNMPIHIYLRQPIERSHANYEYILTKQNYILR